MPHREEIRAFLASNELCRELPDEALEDLAKGCVLRCLESHEVFSRRGDPVSEVYGIRSGFVKALTVSIAGGQYLGDVIGAGEWSGFAVWLHGLPRDFDHQALGPVEIVVLDGRALESVLAQHSRLYGNIARIIATRYLMLFDQVRAHSFLDAETALALRISNLLARHGEASPDGGRELPFRISQEELGSLIGVTREAVGRVLRRWAVEGWVDLGYARMIVRDPAALRALLLPLGEGAPGATAPLSPAPPRAGR